MEKPLILCYALPEEDRLALARFAKRFGADVRGVSPAAYSLPIAAVVGGGLEGVPTALVPELPESMLIFANFPEVMLDVFLDALRASSVRKVPLKAVVTATNAAWRADELYRELCRERAAVRMSRK
ncbi:MAG: DUF3783 domain-containing protein [Clostridia bacterium]|nr:DUF3783 domain-containing protein [Clostridia bacterium]